MMDGVLLNDQKTRLSEGAFKCRGRGPKRRHTATPQMDMHLISLPLSGAKSFGVKMDAREAG